MISNSREKGLQAKQEGDMNEIRKLISKPPLSSSSRQWSGFRNPRVVHVSRSFGGKDRHSKVCTIRGIRDRRIRLSVPTAIQLYDLQDRLGLSQPSKVIDWLLDVTKHDIDKLPPLRIPQGLFGRHRQFHHHQQQQQMMATLQSDTTSTSSLYPFFDGAGGIKINSTNVDNDNGDQDQSNKYWDLEASSLMRAKGKEVERGHEDKNSMPSINPYYYHWDPANLSLSQFGSSGYDQFASQQQADQNALLYSNPFSSPSGSHHHHHLLFCPPAATMPSLFPTYAQEGTTNDHSSRQLINHHLQLWSSSSSSQHNNFMPINSLATSSSQVKPFSLNVNLGHAESNPDKEGT